MKLTKRTYTAARTALESKRDTLAVEVSALEDRYAKDVPPASLCDFWNGLNDALYEVEQEIRHLDRAFSMRNWTSQDWQHAELVWNNVD